jgi:glycerol-3-phosphate dehydrogenase (NAD(P)+)
MQSYSIGTIGGGAWGTALAQLQAAEGRSSVLWAREDEVVRSVNNAHENKPYLPGVALHENLTATSDLAEVAQQDILLLVTPAQYMRDSLEALKPHVRPDQPLVICSKGIEIATGKLLSAIVYEILGPKQPLAVMTGPTFASEIARGMPSAVTIAAKDESLAELLQHAIGAKAFRPYTASDMVGAQLGGAVKNVVAIAAGIATGRGMGESARAALITRGLAETARLCVAMGGKRETLLGMCGVGDLVLTCSSMQSRNCSLGVMLGQGKTLAEVLESRSSVTEGVHTAQAVLKLAKANAVEMPVCQAVSKLLAGDMDVDQVIEYLLSRPFA